MNVYTFCAISNVAVCATAISTFYISGSPWFMLCLFLLCHPKDAAK